MVNLVPCPRTDSTSIWPFIVSMTRLTTSIPTPRPAWSPTAASRWKIRAGKMNLMTCSRKGFSDILPDESQLDGLCLDLGDVETRAVIFDLDQD